MTRATARALVAIDFGRPRPLPRYPSTPALYLISRLAVQEDILGIIQANDRPVAVHVNSATAALGRGEVVRIGDDIRIISSGDVPHPPASVVTS